MTETRRGRKPGGRRNGEGSIRQRPDGSWEARATLPNGKSKSFYGKTAAAARARMTAALQDAREGRDLDRPRERLEDWLRRWLADIAGPRVTPKTLRAYRFAVDNHLIPGLGRVWLDALSPTDVQAFVNERRAAGLSPRTVSHLRAVLRTALNDARAFGLVGRNVAERVSLPALAAPKIDALTPDQAQALMAATADHPYGPLFAVALMTGLRQGELLGLLWRDVDLDAATIRVAQTLKQLPGEPTFGEPKSRRSRRAAPLPAVAVAALKRQHERQAAQRAAAGDRWREQDLVFTRPDGRPLVPTTVTKALQAELARADLPRLTFHQLRHGTTSLLLAQGVPLEIISRLLGHSTVALTLDVYGHLAPEVQRQAAAALDALFAPPAAPSTHNSTHSGVARDAATQRRVKRGRRVPAVPSRSKHAK